MVTTPLTVLDFQPRVCDHAGRTKKMSRRMSAHNSSFHLKSGSGANLSSRNEGHMEEKILY